MSGDFKNRHLDLLREQLYIKDEATFLNPLTYAHGMEQTRSSIDIASGHTLHDCWNDEREVWL